MMVNAHNVRKGQKVYDMALSKEAKRARAAYMREYRRKHPEKIKEIEQRKWERKAVELAEKQKEASNE
jgi:hypothetical protein